MSTRPLAAEIDRLRGLHPRATSEHLLIMLAERFHMTVEMVRERIRAEQAGRT